MFFITSLLIKNYSHSYYLRCIGFGNSHETFFVSSLLVRVVDQTEFSVRTANF